MTPVVLIAEELAPAALDVLADDFDVRHVDGTDRPALLAALADAHAVIVRSATQIDAEAIAAGPRLRVVARAGVGLDNIEVPAATARGVMVVNAPTSNIVSAAEQAVALLLAVARHTASASTSLKAGEWKRSKYTGVELQGKTVGVVGLGRIGVLFAQRMAAFGTRLIAYDPYVQPARAAALGVRLVGLEELLRESDFISIHLPKTPETVGLIGAKELQIVKPGVRIINAARGGLIDEQALADALAEGRVAGAGIDVYLKEPCTSSPLFAFDNGGRDPAPGRVHRRGAGQGRPGRGPQREARAAGRVRAGRGQRAGRWRGRRGRAAAAAARREAGPGLHRGRRRGRRQRHRRGPRRGGRQRRQRAEAGRHQGAVRAGGRGAGHLRQRAAPGGRPRGRGQPDHVDRDDRPPEPGHRARRPARRPGRRGLRHLPARAAGGGQADRAGRVPAGAGRGRACCCSSGTPTAPAWSA